MLLLFQMLLQVSPLLDTFTKVNDINLFLKDLYVSEAKCFKSENALF